MSPRDIDPEVVAQELELRVRASDAASGAPPAETCVIRKGPRAYKVATVRTFMSAEGEIRKRELRFQTWPMRLIGGGFDFSNPTHNWHCENTEIDVLREFINNKIPDEGKYRLVRSSPQLDDLIRLIQSGQIGPEQLRSVIGAIAGDESLIDWLASSNDALVFTRAIEIRRRQEGLHRLREVIEDPKSTETIIHRELVKNLWIFGGQFTGRALRQQLTTLDTLDIPLIEGDGSLHVVELKGAVIPGLVRSHRNHWILGDDVHEAVSQAMNYLRSLDEHRHGILADHRIEVRRSFATVLVGHPMFIRDKVDADQAAETFRTYNSHLSRVRVMMYSELLESASRMLEFEVSESASMVEEEVNSEQRAGITEEDWESIMESEASSEEWADDEADPDDWDHDDEGDPDGWDPDDEPDWEGP